MLLGLAILQGIVAATCQMIIRLLSVGNLLQFIFRIRWIQLRGLCVGVVRGINAIEALHYLAVLSYLVPFGGVTNDLRSCELDRFLRHMVAGLDVRDQAGCRVAL